jgi:hypothetical protein
MSKTVLLKNQGAYNFLELILKMLLSRPNSKGPKTVIFTVLWNVSE